VVRRLSRSEASGEAEAGGRHPGASHKRSDKETLEDWATPESMAWHGRAEHKGDGWRFFPCCAAEKSTAALRAGMTERYESRSHGYGLMDMDMRVREREGRRGKKKRRA
jgi:hypothetical protein